MPVSDPENPFQGEAYLRDLVADRLREIDRAPGPLMRDGLRQAWHQVHGAADALASSGLVPPSIARPLLAELEGRLLQHGLVEVVHRRGARPWAGDAAQRNDSTSEPDSTPEFQRVLPLHGEADRLLPGHVCRYLSLDVWSDHLALHLAIAPPRTERAVMTPSPGQHSGWEGVDDRGGRYVCIGTSWHPSTEAIHFAPGITPGATEVRLFVPGPAGPLTELVIQIPA